MWGGWGIILGLVPHFVRDIWSQNVGNIIFVCYILNIGRGPKTNQVPSHFSKQSIPGLFYLEPHRKVNATTLELFTTNFKNLKNNWPNCFQTLTFCRNLGFQKSWICQWIYPGLSTEAEADKKCGGGWGAGAPPLPRISERSRRSERSSESHSYNPLINNATLIN